MTHPGHLYNGSDFGGTVVQDDGLMFGEKKTQKGSFSDPFQRYCLILYDFIIVCEMKTCFTGREIKHKQ